MQEGIAFPEQTSIGRLSCIVSNMFEFDAIRRHLFPRTTFFFLSLWSYVWLTFELVARHVPPVLPREHRPPRRAIDVSRQGLLAQAAESPRAAKIAASLVEGHLRMRLLTHDCGLEATCSTRAGYSALVSGSWFSREQTRMKACVFRTYYGG